VIEKRNTDGTYNLLFDCDGEKYSDCPEEKIRKMGGEAALVEPTMKRGRFKKGMEVQAQTMAGGGWYEGVVVSYNATERTYKIVFSMSTDGVADRFDVPEVRVKRREDDPNYLDEEQDFYSIDQGRDDELAKTDDIFDFSREKEMGEYEGTELEPTLSVPT
jgi:hypothetical protein